mgnify:CR=1 FL=1
MEYKYGADDGAMENRMENVLTVWLENPLLTFEEIADKAHVGSSTFWRYRQNPEYMAEYHKRCRERFSGLEAKAIEVLDNKLGRVHTKESKIMANRIKPAKTISSLS